MAVVSYTCTVCKRTIDLTQNKVGLDWIGNCNITLGCRGQLQQQEVYLDYVRGQLPPDVVGLRNWVQRQVLYNFTQTVPRATWTINHDLGILPSVIAYVNVTGTTTQQEIIPEQIVYNTDDTLTLIFPTAYSGIAQLIGRYSNPDILNPRPIPALPTPPPTIQLTNNGELTIATRLATIGSLTELPVTLTYTNSSGNTISVNYTADSTASDTSPWLGVSQVLIQGKVYTVRTFNIQTTSGAIANGSAVAMTGVNPIGALVLPVVGINYPDNAFVIANDYTLYFEPNTTFQISGAGLINDVTWVVVSSTYDPITMLTTIIVTNTISPTFPIATALILQAGSREIVPGEVLILLGSSPFTIYDQITNAFVDFTAVNTATTQFDIFYNAGDLFADTSIETTVYPPIRSV
jgi:hypothetical protein